MVENTILERIKTTKAQLTGVEKYLTSHWKEFQNDKKDKLSNFIYFCNSLDEVIKNYNRLTAQEKTDINLEYVVRRFYNFKTSKLTEEIFASFEHCRKEVNERDRKKDIFIYETNFDVKLSTIPKKIINEIIHENNLKSELEFQSFLRTLAGRDARNKIIKELYSKQSSQQRYHLENRIFVLVKDISDKMNFELILEKVQAYMRHLENNKKRERKIFNEVILLNNLNVKSEIILVA